MGALHLDEGIAGSLNYILAVPSPVCGGRPERCALAERNYDPVEGREAGGEEDMEFLVFPQHDGGVRENCCGEVEA